MAQSTRLMLRKFSFRLASRQSHTTPVAPGAIGVVSFQVRSIHTSWLTLVSCATATSPTCRLQANDESIGLRNVASIHANAAQFFQEFDDWDVWILGHLAVELCEIQENMVWYDVTTSGIPVPGG